jgi:hypothetical protein
MSTGIDKQIIKAENIDLSGKDILRITDDKCTVMPYENLENIKSIDEILELWGAVVILYETKKNFGHWVGLFKVNDSTLEFYDPYALNVDEELNFDNDYHKRIHNGVEIPHLTHLLNQSNYRVIYNKVRMQKVLDHVNTCGRHVALRIRMRDVKLKRYQELLMNNAHYDADFFVSALTLLI